MGSLFGSLACFGNIVSLDISRSYVTHIFMCTIGVDVCTYMYMVSSAKCVLFRGALNMRGRLVIVIQKGESRSNGNQQKEKREREREIHK